MNNQLFASVSGLDIPLTKEEQMEQMMQSYGKDVLYLCYTYVREWSMAEDLSQEVFLKIYRKADSFRGEAKPKTWVLKIAANHCKDYIKSAHYRYSVVTSKIQQYIKGSSSTVEETAIFNDEKHTLSQHVFSLPLKYREVIFLFYYEELSLQEISDSLNTNGNTIKSRLKKAKSLLKNELQGGSGDGRA